MKTKTEHKIAQVFWDQPLSRSWRTHDLAAVLVGSVRTLRVIFESWLLISCMKMPFSEFPRSYMHQARRPIARKVAWQTMRCSAGSAVCRLWSSLLFCSCLVGRLSFASSWSCHASIFMIIPFGRWPSSFKQWSASSVGLVHEDSMGLTSVLIQLSHP